MGPAVGSTPAAEDLAAHMDAFLQAHAQLNRFSGAVLVAKAASSFSSGVTRLPASHRMSRIQPLADLRAAHHQAIHRHRYHAAPGLSTFDPFCRFVKNCPASWRFITIHQLHTSGIPEFSRNREIRKIARAPGSLFAATDLVRENPLEFSPGEEFSYSNTGFLLLGQVLEKVSGETYAAYLRRHPFQPLGMNDTVFDETMTIMPNRANGYRNKRRSTELGTPEYGDPS